MSSKASSGAQVEAGDWRGGRRNHVKSKETMLSFPDVICFPNPADTFCSGGAEAAFPEWKSALPALVGPRVAQWGHPKPCHRRAGDQAMLEMGEEATRDQQTPLGCKKEKNPNPQPPAGWGGTASALMSHQPAGISTPPLTDATLGGGKVHLSHRDVRVQEPLGSVPPPRELNRTPGAGCKAGNTPSSRGEGIS